jgi:hypothetical protein
MLNGEGLGDMISQLIEEDEKERLVHFIEKNLKK